jgi:Fusaric acid resistance protein-like
VRVGAALTPLIRFRESPPRLVVATQAGVAMLLSIGVPTLAGRQDLGLLASAGALSAAYFAGRTPVARARLLPLVQLGILASAAFGAAAGAARGAAPWLLCAFTIAAAVPVLALRVGPPAVLFFVLVAGLASRVTGLGAVQPGLLLTMVAAGCVVAYLVVVAPLLLPAVRRSTAGHAPAPGLDLETRIILGRLAVAAVLATALALGLGLERVYWVLLSVVAILQNGRGRRLTAVRGAHRLLGTVVGVGAFVAIAAARPSGLLLVAIVALLQFVTELVIVRHYGLALVLITPLALIIVESAGGDVLTTATIRVIDTAVGAGAAMLVLVVELGVERMLARRRPDGSTARSAGSQQT